MWRPKILRLLDTRYGFLTLTVSVAAVLTQEWVLAAVWWAAVIASCLLFDAIVHLVHRRLTSRGVRPPAAGWFWILSGLAYAGRVSVPFAVTCMAVAHLFGGVAMIVFGTTAALLLATWVLSLAWNSHLLRPVLRDSAAKIPPA